MQTEQWWWFWSKVCWVLAGCMGLSLLVSLAMLLGGCNQTKPAAPLPAATPTKATAATKPAVLPAAGPSRLAGEDEVREDEAREGKAREGKAPAEPGRQDDAQKAKVSAKSPNTGGETVSQPTEPPPLPPLFAVERVLLLLPRNPLIIEFQLSIDGRPHTAAMDRLVEEVLKLADTDADGRPTWKEISESKRFKYGQFGNLPIAGEDEYKQIIERYDVDRDAAVDAGELPRFLTRNAGSARPFSVRGTADFREPRGGGAPLWQLLDADEDGAISPEEFAAAPGRMFTRDTDDDEILLPGDLNPRVPLDMGLVGTRVRRGGLTLVRLLGPHADWDSVRLSLEEHYAGGHNLRPDSFPLTPDLFARLDVNQDDRIVKTELAGLNAMPPHLIIAARFGTPEPKIRTEPAEPEAKAEPETKAEPEREGEAPAEPEREGEAPAEPQSPAGETPTEPSEEPAPPPPPLELISMIPALADAGHSPIVQSGRLTFRVADTTITFYLNDTVAGGDFAAQAQQALTALDGDKNGYLEKTEVPENAAPQLGQFEAVDADGNEKVYLDEIVAFLQQQQAGLRAQVHAKASDRQDALFAALDGNHDERLDAREVEETPKRLAQLDISGDGRLTSDEIPESLTFGLARGNLENMDALFVLPMLVVVAPAADTPRWFASMDANGDGAISRREFLGTPEKFAAFDTSGDGLLDVAEAKAAQP